MRPMFSLKGNNSMKKFILRKSKALLHVTNNDFQLAFSGSVRNQFN